MTATATPPTPVLDWLDAHEECAANSFRRFVDDEGSLEHLSHAWRRGFSAISALPNGQRLATPVPQDLSRGGDAPGGLGDDYPLSLFESMRVAWSTAFGGLAITESCLPFGWKRAADVASLATLIACSPPPAIAPTPADVVLETPTLRLRRVANANATGEPIVLVAPMINRWYVLDLLPERSFLSLLASFGRPVYVIEWRPPASNDDRGFGDLCGGPMLEAVDHALNAEGADSSALIGYCQGGTLAAMFAARFPLRVARVATVCAPVRFSEGGLFRRWFDPKYLDVDLTLASSERISAWLVHLPFWWLRPSIKTRKLTGLARSFRKDGVLEQFLASELWNSDHMDMSRGVFRTWTGDLYQKDLLERGLMVVAGEAVHLERIAQPLLVISGDYDPITPPSAAEPLGDLSSSQAATLLRVRSGHVGVVTSPRALASQRAALNEWLEASE